MQIGDLHLNVQYLLTINWDIGDAYCIVVDLWVPLSLIENF